MLNFLKLLRRAPHIERIKDPEQIDQNYKYWRIRLLYSTYIGYALFYLTRKNLAFVLPAMVTELHFSKEALGILGSAFYITYGISKFISGILSDKSNPRYFMALGLIATGITNIVFGFTSSFFLLTSLWIINAFFQGWGWPPCARILTRWYSQKERGTWWSIWNTSHNVGGGLIPIIAGFCAVYLGWRYAMFIPGIIAITIGFVLMNRLRDVPESEGLPPVEEYKNDYPDNVKLDKKDISTKEILIEYVLKNKYMWLLAMSYVLVYIVRTGINDWSALFLTEKGNTLLASDGALSFFEIGGLFGTLLAGWASDKIFGGRRGPINVLFSIGIVLVLVTFWLAPVGHFILNAACLFGIGFFVFGPQMLIGVAAAELCHHEAAGTATGFVGLFAYLGAALSGYPLGYITHHFGWNWFFIALGICALMTVGLLMFLWPVQSRQAKPIPATLVTAQGEEIA